MVILLDILIDKEGWLIYECILVWQSLCHALKCFFLIIISFYSNSIRPDNYISEYVFRIYYYIYINSLSILFIYTYSGSSYICNP